MLKAIPRLLTFILVVALYTPTEAGYLFGSGGAPNCVGGDTASCTLAQTRSSSDADFIATNIRAGTDILGITGSLTAAYAQCSNDGSTQCSLSATRSTDDAQFTAGNIKDSVNILNVLGTYAPACTGNASIECALNTTRSTSDADFIAGNIKNGTNILNVTGTYIQPGDTTTSLTHWWKFDDTSGTNATEQISGLTSTLTNGPVWSPTEGINGGALYFDGTNDVVIVGSPVPPTGDFTVSMWIDSPVQTGAGLLGVRNTTPGNELLVGIATTPTASIDGHAVLSFGTIPQTNGWHMVSWTRSGELFTYYLDGTRQVAVSAPGTLSYSTCSLFIGAQPNGACGNNGVTSLYTGLIDDVRIYSRALSALDLAKLFHDFADSPTVQTTDLTTGLLLHLAFEENTGTALNDSGPNNHDGTLVNGPTWTTGKVGSFAVTLDNTNDYIEITTPGISTGDFTYAGWFKPVTLDTTDSFFNIQSASAGSTTALDFARNSDVVNKVLINGSVALSNVPGTYTTSWIHIAATRRGQFLRLYLNGKPIQGTIFGTAITYDGVCQLIIGMDPDGTLCTGTPTDYFGGSVDDIWVFTRALTTAEVAALAAM